MPTLTLPYQAGREWMEQRILAGEPLKNRRQVFTLEVDDIPASLRVRLANLLHAVAVDALPARAVVLDSGIDPTVTVHMDENDLFGGPMHDPIRRSIGALPELPAPTGDVLELLDAWDEWLRRYREAALQLFARWQESPPHHLTDADGGDKPWGPIRLSLGRGVFSEIDTHAGPAVVQAAMAGKLRTRYLERSFDSESVAAAREATLPSAREIEDLAAAGDQAAIADWYLNQTRKISKIALAHDRARRAQMPDFEAEMRSWASQHGSARLRMGLEDGYRMTGRYLTERIAKEAPGFFAQPVGATIVGWASVAANPSEAALVLRRRVAAAMAKQAPDGSPPRVEIMRVVRPPHEMYIADAIGRPDGGWDWYEDEDGSAWAEPRSFEAVIVHHWLGRYHLVGAVRLATGARPAGIWAAPDPDLYSDDGHVTPVDPDEPGPSRVKRKPPARPDDDIPF